jgi:hypothetical protein
MAQLKLYINGLQSCPCPDECISKLDALNIPNECVAKEKRLREIDHTTCIQEMLDGIWEIMKGSVPPADKETCLKAFQIAYERHTNGEEKTSPCFYMNEYTLSPTIVLYAENRAYPIGGKTSLLNLLEHLGYSC